MDVVLLWFRCKDKNCNLVPIKNKREMIDRYWRHGKSIQESYKQRIFMRYVEGNYRRLYFGDVTLFDCKYGTVVLFDPQDLMDTQINSSFYPLEDKEICNQCLQRIKNEGALFQ